MPIRAALNVQTQALFYIIHTTPTTYLLELKKSNELDFMIVFLFYIQCSKNHRDIIVYHYGELASDKKVCIMHWSLRFDMHRKPISCKENTPFLHRG